MKTMICAAIVFLVAAGSPLHEPVRAQPGERIPLPRNKSGYSSQPGGASFSRGVGLLEQRKFAEAVTALQAALRRNPRNVDYHLALTHALAGAERPREAWRSFRTAAAIERDHPRLAPALVDVWRAFGRTGLFNVGRSAKDVSALLGKPTRVENHGHQQRWFYEFMAVNTADDKVESVMDVRGLRRESLVEADRLKFQTDGRAWRAGHRVVSSTHTITEYVLTDQQVQNWQELVTVERWLGLVTRGVKPKDIMLTAKKDVERSDAGARWNVMDENEDDCLFEWSFSAGDERPAQYEMVRLIGGKNDIYRVAYARRKTAISSQQRAQWVKLLRSAELVPVSSR